MENGLPNTIPELKAEIKFYELMQTNADMIRIGPRAELSPCAARELKRIEEVLEKRREKLKRLERKEV